MIRAISWARSGAVVALLLAGPAMAQVSDTSPAGVGNEQQRRQQQIEQSRPSPQILPQPAPVTGPDVAPAGKPSASVSFLLNGVTFDASAFLTAAELDAVAKPYIGRKVDFADLHALTDKINALYRTKGQITAQAVVPPQQLLNGVVHISLVEGHLANISIVGAKNTRESYIRNRITLRAGETVDGQRLSEDIVYFNRTGDDQLRAVLRPGANFGETDLQLAVQEPAPDMLDIFADNEGVESTGQIEGGISYRHNGLAHSNDRLFLYGVLSKGGLTGSASYDIPIDVANTRIGIAYQRNNIKVVNGPYGSLGISGHGQSFGLNLTHPLVATPHWLFTGILSGAYSTSTTADPASSLTDTNTYRGGAGLSLTYIGEAITGVITSSVSLAQSHDQLLGTDRDIFLAAGSASARVNLGWQLSARVLASGQYSNDRLLPADFLFQIGGASSVRGYDAGTFAGDSGYLANFELHRDSGDLIPGLDIFAFTDVGTVYSTSSSMRSLNSAGTGLSFTPGHGFPQLIGTLAVPLKDVTPNQSDYRGYLQLLFHF